MQVLYSLFDCVNIQNIFESLYLSWKLTKRNLRKFTQIICLKIQSYIAINFKQLSLFLRHIVILNHLL